MLNDLKAGPRVVGIRQTRRALTEGRAACVFLAEDADPAVTGPIEALCAQHGADFLRVSSTRELGRACGISVGATAAALLRR